MIVSRSIHNASPPPLVSAAPGAPLKTAIEPDGVDFSLLSPVGAGYRPALLSVFLIRLFFTSAGMASTAAAVGSCMNCIATQATPIEFAHKSENTQGRLKARRSDTARARS